MSRYSGDLILRDAPDTDFAGLISALIQKPDTGTGYSVKPDTGYDIRIIGSKLNCFCSVLDPDPDPEGRKSTQTRRKIKSEDQKKIIKISTVFSKQSYVRQRSLSKNV
jgi:hypothetical protein